MSLSRLKINQQEERQEHGKGRGGQDVSYNEQETRFYLIDPASPLK